MPRNIRLQNFTYQLAGILFFSALATTGTIADSGDDLSCAYFSTDPDDRSGPPIEFYADLSDDAQSAPTDSPGVGRAEFVLERDTLRLSWRVTYQNLTTAAVGLHVHGPKAPAVDASILFDMAPESLSSPINGERILSLGEATNLIQHLLYLNLHTSKYPEGELRGPIRKARPTC